MSGEGCGLRSFRVVKLMQCMYLNRTHKRALRILQNDYSSSFEELLRKSNECTIHIKRLQKLVFEVYKCISRENPSFMWNMFHEKSSQYDLM